uniref:Uncharacterized protein n=1 Tax=Glossina pallidipes TaxID=7398 RepID=A0A1A9Z8E8_GLOPL
MNLRFDDNRISAAIIVEGQRAIATVDTGTTIGFLTETLARQLEQTCKGNQEELQMLLSSPEPGPVTTGLTNDPDHLGFHPRRPACRNTASPVSIAPPSQNQNKHIEVAPTPETRRIVRDTRPLSQNTSCESSKDSKRERSAKRSERRNKIAEIVPQPATRRNLPRDEHVRAGARLIINHFPEERKICEQYTIYDLTEEIVEKKCWPDTTVLLVVCGPISAAFGEIFVDYFLRGGKVLSLCSDVLHFILPNYRTAEVLKYSFDNIVALEINTHDFSKIREHELVQFSYDKWHKVKMMHHMTLISERLKNLDIRLKWPNDVYAYGINKIGGLCLHSFLTHDFNKFQRKMENFSTK